MCYKQNSLLPQSLHGVGCECDDTLLLYLIYHGHLHFHSNPDYYCYYLWFITDFPIVTLIIIVIISDFPIVTLIIIISDFPIVTLIIIISDFPIVTLIIIISDFPIVTYIIIVQYYV